MAEINCEEIVEELSNRVEDVLGEQIENAITCALQDVLPEIFSECLSNFEFELPNGTTVRPIRHMKVLSPDKSKLLLCYGGLRVDGNSLTVQTGIGRWETISCYSNRSEAIEALLKVKKALDSNVSSFEL